MITPNHRLPFEILHAIFNFYSSCHKDSPLELLWVCGSWRAIALAMPGIWSKVRLRTWTNVGKVVFILATTATSPLHVEIDVNLWPSRNSKSLLPRYAGLWQAATEAYRWRSLTISSLSSDEYLDFDSFFKTLPVAFGRPLEGLRSLKIRCGEGISLLPSIPFHDNMITDMELSFSGMLDYIMRPQSVAVFRTLIRFKVSFTMVGSAVDILAELHQLETLEARGLRLPPYPVEAVLPLVHTLKYMKINDVSVQWMAGRTFYNLEECEITKPLNIEMISLGCRVNLPICTKFVYDNSTIDTLANFCIPSLDILTIRGNSPWLGSGELAAIWSAAPKEAALLKPRILSLDTRCHEQYLLDALSMLPELEELHLGHKSSSGLSQRFFTSLQAKEEKGWDTQAVTHVSWLCPSLKRLNIYYSSWRLVEICDEITSILHQVAKSRQNVDMALQDVKFQHCMTNPMSPPWGSPVRSDPWLALCE